MAIWMMESFVLNFAAVLLLVLGPCDIIDASRVQFPDGCHHAGNLRLNQSVLQICKEYKWKIVCSEGWGNLDAAVACRQLGFDGGYTNSTTISNPALTEVDPVVYHCTGRENRLQDCVYENYTSCSATQGAILTCVHRNSSDACTSGDIRFVHNTTEYEGYIELCTDHGLWSLVTNYLWDYHAMATVACRQLGFTDSIALRGSNIYSFISRLQPEEYGGLICRGNETSLQSCRVHDYYVERLSNLQYGFGYAQVSCLPRINGTCKHGALRVTNGYSNNNGLTELCINGVWTGFCPGYISYPSITETMSHICNQLGYQNYIALDGSIFKSNRSNPLHYVHAKYSCQLQSSLLDCIYNNTYYGFQYHRSCTTQLGVLCCPNDTALCSFQSSTCTATSSKAISDKEAQFSLHFGTFATSLLKESSSDLRGLKADIEDKIIACVSEEPDCPNKNCMAPVNSGFFSVGDTLTYTSNLDKLHCVNALKKCLEKDPWIQYHGSDIHFVASIVEE